MEPSHEDEISSASVTINEGEGDCRVRSPLEAGREECSTFSESLDLELRRFLEENASLAAAVNTYKGRVKNSEKKVEEENLNGVALLGELKHSKEEV